MTNQAIIFNFQLIPHKIFQTYRFWLDPQYTGMIAPLNWETISVCIFPGFIAAGAGAVEAVMTMEEVNDRTETENESPNQYLFALSLGNAVAAIYGTIGGGANIPM